MNRNEWKTASEQLLGHWRRSGITQLPTANEALVAKAIGWIKEHSDQILTQDVVLPPAKQRVADSSSNQVDSPTNVPVSQVSMGGQKGIPSPVAEAVAQNSSEVMEPEGPRPTANNVSLSWLTPATDFVTRQSSFQVLNEQVNACRKCEDIVCRRQRTVFGVGSLNARVVMFGEAPGADEDRVGEPFVGAAGQLLDKILAASGFKREDVYIMNSLKCRPPNNRTPTDGEIDNCRPFFETQLETIQPEYIVCWGSVAVRAVLKSTESVGRLRGRFHGFRGAKVMVTYHPAYLLRNPDAKRLTWDDMKMLLREMGLPIPSPK